MAKLRKYLDKIRERKALSEIVSEAQEEFEEKPYVSEFREENDWANRTRWLLGGISVVSGGYGCIGLSSSPWLLVPLGLLVLSIVELFKNKSVYRSVRNWLLFGILSPWLSVAIILFIASVGASLFGGISLMKDMEAKAHKQATANYQAKADSVATVYRTETDSLSVLADQYYKAVSWKGKLDIAGRKQWQVMQDRVFASQTVRIKAYNDILNEGKQVAGKEANEAGNRGLAIAIFFVSNEVAIIALLVFMVYYRYRAGNDLEVLESEYVQEFSYQDVSSIVSLAKMGVQGGNPFQGGFNHFQGGLNHAGQKHQIGFKNHLASNLQGGLNGSQNSQNTGGGSNTAPPNAAPIAPVNQAQTRATKYSDYRLKYPDLIADLEAVNNGSAAYSIPVMAVKYGVSEATIFRIKKAIFI